MADKFLIQEINSEFLKIKNSLSSMYFKQWNDPELPMMENNSSKRLSNWLKRNNFLIKNGIYKIPTAFKATYKTSNNVPNICILAEYDALPGLANESVPKKKPTDQISGHGCGHNHIGPTNIAAAIIASKVSKKLNIPANITVLGCPAEEILWGKIALFNAGAFSNIDCILTSHGDYQNGSISRPCQSVIAGEIIFEGVSSHSGKINNLNSLLAAENFINSAKKIIQSKYPDILFRHIIRKAGLIPTITPDETRVWFATRGFDFDKNKKSYKHILNLAKILSKKNKTSYTHQIISETRGYLPNHILGKELYNSLKIFGPPKWSNKDLSFMQKLVNQLIPGKKMTLDKKINFYNQGKDFYGQDDGEVSWRIPLGRLNWAYPEEIPIHHWAWTALSGNRASYQGPFMVAKSLSHSIINLLKNPEIISKSKKELDKRTKGIKLLNPNLGAFKTLTKKPELFWSANWYEI